MKTLKATLTEGLNWRTELKGVDNIAFVDGKLCFRYSSGDGYKLKPFGFSPRGKIEITREEER
jgi:hypothetical protein